MWEGTRGEDIGSRENLGKIIYGPIEEAVSTEISLPLNHYCPSTWHCPEGCLHVKFLLTFFILSLPLHHILRGFIMCPEIWKTSYIRKVLALSFWSISPPLTGNKRLVTFSGRWGWWRKNRVRTKCKMLSQLIALSLRETGHFPENFSGGRWTTSPMCIWPGTLFSAQNLKD